MKKIGLFFLALLIVFCLVVFAVPHGLPSLNRASSTMAVKPGGKTYLADANIGGNWVYGVLDGQVSEVYRLPLTINGSVATIGQLCTDGTNLVLLQSWESDGKTCWRIMRAGQDEKSFKVIYTEKFKKTPVLSIENGQISLVFLNENDTVAELFSLAETENAAKLVFEVAINAPSGERFASAVAFNKNVWGMVSSGGVFQNNAAMFAAGAPLQANLISVNSGMITFFNNVQRKAYISGGIMMNEIIAPAPNYSITAGGASDEGNLFYLAETGGKVVLLRYAGTGYEPINELSVSPKAWFAFKMPILLFGASAFVLLLLLTSGVYWLLLRCRKLFVRIMGICVVFVALACALFVPFSLRLFQQQVSPVNQAAVKALGLQRAAQISLLNIQSTGDFDKGRFASVLDVLEQEGASTAVITAHAGELVVLAAQGVPVGTSVRAAFGPRVHEIITSAVLRGESAEYVETDIEKSPMAYGLQVLWKNSVKPAYLFTIMPCGVYLQNVQTTINRAMLVLVIIISVILLLFGLAVFIITKPLHRLLQTVLSIKEGETKVMKSAGKAPDEVGDLERTVDEMSARLSVREYDYDKIIHSYSRFVPDGMEKLLGRASAVEVCSGDMVQVKGCVAFACITNRNHVRATLDDKRFVEFISRCYDSVYNNAHAHGGILLENAFNLSSLKMLFKGQEADATSFSLALLETENVKNSAKEMPAYFQLLHETTFLYGVTGSSTRAINFLSSAKIDFLEDICMQFEKINCRLVMTDHYLKGREANLNTRYIGFVSSADKKMTHKLYEVLDVYNSIERSRRQQYSSKFQSAINMYYKNEFHKARNAFSGMLKICPTDGVVRWYLHACEHYSQWQSREDFSYGLFDLQME